MTRIAAVWSCLCILICSAAAEPAADKPVELREVVAKTFGGAKPETMVAHPAGLASPAKAAAWEGTPAGLTLTIPETGTSWKGYCGAGQATLQAGDHFEVTFAADGEAVTAEWALQLFGGAGCALASLDPQTRQAGDATVTTVTIPETLGGKRLSALWLTATARKPGATLTLQSIRLLRRPVDNTLDAEKILASPPVHDARVEIVQGMPAFVIDGKPVSRGGWAHIQPRNVADGYIQAMVENVGRIHGLPVVLGEHVTLNYYTPTWLGPDEFDFRTLDTQARRIVRHGKDVRLILYVVLDGARWWTRRYPDHAQDVERGIPDYLSPLWQRDARHALRQLIAHVQSQDYGSQVIGYQLFNGATLDCNFQMVETNRSREAFRDFLREQYNNDVAKLRKAWNDPEVTFEAARRFVIQPLNLGCSDETAEAIVEYAETDVQFLVDPSRHAKYLDSKRFAMQEHSQVVLNFCRWVKEATHGRALAGARDGDLMSQQKSQNRCGGMSWIDHEMLESEDLDFIEVQEPYWGREFGLGMSVAGQPVKGLAMHNKLIVVQNDVRTHLSSPTERFGRTPDLPSTIQMQRRVFASAMIQGMSPYLWQMAYRYDDPKMLAEFRRMETIFAKSLSVPRQTGAKLAIVIDNDYPVFLGWDHETQWARLIWVNDSSRYPWTKAGLPFDVIFLDDLDPAMDYDVFVFMNTFQFTAANRRRIAETLNRPGKVGVFTWAAGLIGDTGWDVQAMSETVGMELALSDQARTFRSAATELFAELGPIKSGKRLGILDRYDSCAPDAGETAFAPALEVVDESAVPLARDADGRVTMAMAENNGAVRFYTNSVNLDPALLRLAASKAGLHLLTPKPLNDAHLLANESFLALHTGEGEPITLTFPEPTALYEVFRDEQHPAATQHVIHAVDRQTYLFFRGDKASFDAIPLTND